MKKTVSFLVVLIFFVSVIFAQEKEEPPFSPTMSWSGWTHIWTTYTTSDLDDPQYGMAIRYLRLKASGKLQPNVKWSAQLAFDKGAAGFVDVLMAYEPKDYFKIQVGQFGVPGVKAGALTDNLFSTTKQIFNDRPTIVQNWGSNMGLSGYRSIGSMVYGSFSEGLINYYIMAAASKAGVGNYYNASVKSPTYSHDENGMTLYSRLEIKPFEEMAAGLHFNNGTGLVDDTVSTKRSSYGAYVIYKKSDISFTAEYVAGLIDKEINDVSTGESKYNGFYVEAGYMLQKKYQPAIRVDNYVPVIDGNDKYGAESYMNYTIGLNYYPAKNIALMLNYVIRGESMIQGVDEMNNDLIYLQIRYKCADK